MSGPTISDLTLCPHCGHASQDREFCDVCNREMESSVIAAGAPPVCVTLSDGREVNCEFWRTAWPENSDSHVRVVSGTLKARVHGVRPDLWNRFRGEIEGRARLGLKALPPIEIVPAGQGAIVVADAWDDDVPNAITAVGPSQLSECLEQLRRFDRVVSELHSFGLVWLNFDPSAIETRADGARVTNLDIAVYRAGECRDRLRVSRLYSPPEVCRFQGSSIGPATDVYHLGLFAYYSLAGLLPAGFQGGGLEAFGFEIPPLRIYAPELVVGVWPVLERALATDPTQRYPVAAEFVTRFEEAVLAAEARCRKSTLEGEPKPRRIDYLKRLLRFIAGVLNPRRNRHKVTETPPAEIGFLTVAGAAKSAVGAANQDAVDVARISTQGRSIDVVVVADGVSVARVGRGELASGIACRTILDILRSEIKASTSEICWRKVFERTCIAASEAVVAAALAEPNLPSDVRDSDVMSTTALIAVLDGGILHLANVGDSRAYLLNETDKKLTVEQLTVDGDVGTSLLCEGIPPEQVRDMGSSAKALRYCLGACLQKEDGTIACNHVRSTPRYSTVTLLEGDTVILCSDGLVEEGVFLEPREVAEVSALSANVSAQDLAQRLVEAADRRQRLPSENEPKGFGDNITCVVIRLSGAANNSASTGSTLHG